MVKPGLDGLSKHKLSDQTVQARLNSCQRAKSYEARPVGKMYDLTSLPQKSYGLIREGKLSF